MKKIIHIRKTFIHQISDADCGIACLRSLLGYAGLPNSLAIMQEIQPLHEQGLSLLDLRVASGRFGLTGRCVEMDFEHLRQSLNPCILHVTNEWGQGHFVVHYGLRKSSDGKIHIIGDPASHVYAATETKLNEIWKGRGALYFDDFPAISKKRRELPWQPLFSLKVFPRQLWLVIPFLSIVSTVLGLATSLTLEKGADITLAGNRSIIFAVLVLLSLITLFKSLISYLRQRALITMNAVINEKLVSRIIFSLARGKERIGKLPDVKIISSLLIEVNRVQMAFYNLVSVMLSEGLIVLGCISFLCYQIPVVALLVVLYLIILLNYTNNKLPIISYRYAHLHQLEYKLEHQILNYIARLKETSTGIALSPVEPKDGGHHVYIDKAKYAAFLTSKVSLHYEVMGTILITSAISYGIAELYMHKISYGVFLAGSIISYLITTIGPKIGSAIVTVSEAAEMTKKLNDRLANFS